MSQPATHHYLPLPPRNLQTPPPEYHLPVLITTYSHLPDRSITHDDSSMAYYSPAPLGADLTYGFEKRIERDENLDEHLDGLCEGLWEAHRAGKGGERKGGIITWRGMITRIMTAPFEDSEGWEMTAIPLDGSIYVEQHDPPNLRADRRKKQSAWALQSYMGMAYESYSTIQATSDKGENSPDDPEGWSGDVNTNVQWCNIVRSAIGDIPLCLGGEVDCIDEAPGTSHPGLQKCIELKTNKVIDSEKQESIFHRKMLKHWAQSWLLGIPTIQFGFRDDDGIVKSRKTFETLKIPRLISSLQNPPWSPTPCHHFLYSFLNLVLTHVLPTDPTPPGGLARGSALPEAVVWRFSFTPRRGCELYRVRGDVGGEAGRWGGVLKEDYVRWRMSRK